MQCIKCGAEVQEDWVACPRCGLSLELPPVEAVVARVLITAIGGAMRSDLARMEAEAMEDGRVDEVEAHKIEREVVEDIEKALLDLTDSYQQSVMRKRRNQLSDEIEDE